MSSQTDRSPWPRCTSQEDSRGHQIGGMIDYLSGVLLDYKSESQYVLCRVISTSCAGSNSLAPNRFYSPSGIKEQSPKEIPPRSRSFITEIRMKEGSVSYTGNGNPDHSQRNDLRRMRADRSGNARRCGWSGRCDGRPNVRSRNDRR